MVVAKELFLDLTQQEEPRQFIQRACRTTLVTEDVREVTVISDLDHAFSVRDLAQIIRQTPLMTSLSLFSVAMTGTSLEFAELAEALRHHRALREVHLVDCGMALSEQSLQLATSTSSVVTPVAAAMALSSAALATGRVLPVPASVVPLALVATSSPMDAVLQALAQIPTLESVEIYAIPSVDDDSRGDDDDEGDNESMAAENFGAQYRVTAMDVDDQDDGDDSIFQESITDDEEEEDDENSDFEMDEDGRDIRGIPAARQGRCTNRSLALSMNPTSIAKLFTATRTTGLTNISLEDLVLQDDHIVQIASALMTNKVLKSLKLWGCNIRDSGCYPLAQMLEVNKTLEKLDLSNNRIEDDGCVALADSLRFNVSLKWLCLVGNDCTAATSQTSSDGRGYEALFALLQQNSVLQDLILEPYEVDLPEANDLPAAIFVPVSE